MRVAEAHHREVGRGVAVVDRRVVDEQGWRPGSAGY